jgi:hypothetical protein
MGYFNPTALERVRRYLHSAQRDLIDAQKSCGVAKAELENAGRETQAAAIEMICASLNQSERDIIKWMELTAKTRENGHGG